MFTPLVSAAPAENRRPGDQARGVLRGGGGDMAVVPVGGGGVLGPSGPHEGGVLCPPRRRGGGAGERGEPGHHRVSVGVSWGDVFFNLIYVYKCPQSYVRTIEAEIKPLHRSAG